MPKTDPVTNGDETGCQDALSLSVFFPAYNDAECLPDLLERTFEVLPRLTSEYEVVVVNDGSEDGTAQVLEALVSRYKPYLRTVTHTVNCGYGAALRSGFAACTKDLVFYTDGDGQYDVRDLAQLWTKLRPGVDLVNGYKLNRADNYLRRLIGKLYNRVVRSMFDLKVRDVDCDFRLMRRSLLDRIELHSDSGSICVELILKIQSLSRTIEEVGVHHYPRLHGRSQFFRVRSLLSTLRQLTALYSLRSREAAQPVVSQQVR